MTLQLLLGGLPFAAASAVLTAAAIPENDGWPATWRSSAGCPLVAEFDGQPGLEVITSTWDFLAPEIAAFDNRGRMLPGWPITLESKAYGYPVAGGDLDNDGRLEALIAPRDESGFHLVVHALNHDAQELNGWPISLRFAGNTPPILMDLDSDGRLELAIATSHKDADADSGAVVLVSSDGVVVPGWPFVAAEDFESPVSVGDLDLDGDLELLVATNVGTSGPGWIHAFNHDGSPFGSSHVLAELEEAVAITPVTLVDLVGDLRPEIVTADREGEIRIVTSEGERVEGWPPEQSFGSMAGMPVALGANDGPAWGFLTASDHSVSVLYDAFAEVMPGWPFHGSWLMRSQPITGDLDGDPELEAFVGGSMPYNFSLELDGSVVEGWPVVTESQDFGTGTLTDLDGDGDTDIVFQGYDAKIHVYDTPGLYDHRRIECPRWMYDNWHTGSYHKDLYREVETAERLIGWELVEDAGAWGHTFVRPSTDALVQRSSSLSTDVASAILNTDDARLAPPITAPRPHRLIYRTQVPVWKEYTLWVRVRWPGERDEVALDFSARLDGAPISGGGRVAGSPGPWIWYEVGSIPIEAGSHTLVLDLPSETPGLDRFLFTTRSVFPLLAEAPHDWP